MNEVKISISEDKSILIDNNGALIAIRAFDYRHDPFGLLTELLNTIVPAVRNKSDVVLVSIGGVAKIEW